MIKNNVSTANTIANKIATGGSMTLDVQTSVSYSESRLTECLTDLKRLVQSFSSNVQVDSVNIKRIALTYQKADSSAGKGFSND